jgi:hypothetical protein
LRLWKPAVRPIVLPKDDKRVPRDRRMTYIAAFRCAEGFVCCADTQETVEDQKQYTEKLLAFGSGSYPIVLGGAGHGELVDALTQEISESLISGKPQGEHAVRQCIRQAIDRVYSGDVPYMVMKRSFRSPQLLIALNASSVDSDFQLFYTQGRRVHHVPAGRAIIGYATAPNNALLKRFHDPQMAMGRAIILASYLVSQSKLIDGGVGGETSIAFVSQVTAVIEDASFIRMLEATVNDFVPIVDQLFLLFSDSGLSKNDFENAVTVFTELLRVQRESLLLRTAEYVKARLDHGFLHDIRPYPKAPPGSQIQISVGPETGEKIVKLADDF